MTEGVVAEAVDAVMHGPWVWGAADCCTSACDVFQRLHGIDPMAPLRGRYASEAEALALVRSFGGWRRMFRTLAAAAGLKPGVGAPGEVGLVRETGYSLAIGIGGGMWAGRIDGGYATTDKMVMSCRN
ncbi:hypothetical protein LCM17_22995 [Cereibacter sphaeroides]|nr:hypothetical protein [Cereibacter sphaeroides]